ncbi:MAG: hypothetical protein KF764_00460 [Labilithrix sp.]|nr:hypothetical protein [Labilithrix sp.]
MGSILVAASTSPDPVSDDAEVSVFEWDVAGEKALHSATLPRLPGESTRAVRIARTASRTFVAVEAVARSRSVSLFALGPDLSVLTTKPMGDGDGVSLEASDRWVAVSKVHNVPDSRLTVTLLDPTKLTEIARRDLGGLVTDPGLRSDHLKLGRDRLFALGTPLRPGGPRRNEETGALAESATMFALGLPSLDVQATYDTRRSGQLPVSLVGGRGGDRVHLYADELLELDRSATLVRKRALSPGAVPSFSARGELFDGVDEAARSNLFTPDGGELDSTPRCVSLWSGEARLLVCGLGRDGVRVVRVGKPWPPPPPAED